MTTHTPATAELKNDSDSKTDFAQIFDFGSWSGSERITQNPAGVDSGSKIMVGDALPPLPPLTARHWMADTHNKQEATERE